MKPLHIALVVKNTPASFARDKRNMGMFSYEVEEFTWEHIAPGKGGHLDTDDLKAQGFDAIFHEDGGAWSGYVGDAIPVIFYSIDSTLSEEFHFKPRAQQARWADLVLVDHDRLERFEGVAQKVRRLTYAVNDKLFKPLPKTLDVCFHCGGSPERAPIRTRLSELCKAHGWSYVSGTTDLAEYAYDMGRAKVVVNVPRTPTNRPHRIWDALSCGAAVLSAPLPDVSGEPTANPLVRWGAYVGIWGDVEGLEHWLCEMLDNEEWVEQAKRGWLLAQGATWAVRAKELRGMLECELSV